MKEGAERLFSLMIMQHFLFDKGIRAEACGDYHQAFCCSLAASELKKLAPWPGWRFTTTTALGQSSLTERRHSSALRRPSRAGRRKRPVSSSVTCFSTALAAVLVRSWRDSPSRLLPRRTPSLPGCWRHYGQQPSKESEQRAEACATAGSPAAAATLGIHLCSLRSSASQRKGKAFLKTAAAQGVAQAQHGLGVVSLQQHPHSSENALEWYEKAAAQDFPESCYKLALRVKRERRAYPRLPALAEGGK